MKKHNTRAPETARLDIRTARVIALLQDDAADIAALWVIDSDAMVSPVLASLITELSAAAIRAAIDSAGHTAGRHRYIKISALSQATGMPIDPEAVAAAFRKAVKCGTYREFLRDKPFSEIGYLPPGSAAPPTSGPVALVGNLNLTARRGYPHRAEWHVISRADKVVDADGA